MPAPGLDPASDGPLSWPPGLGAAEDGARYGVAGDRARDGGGVRDGIDGVSEWAAAWQSGAVGHMVRCRVGRGARSSAGWERMQRRRAGEGHDEEPCVGEGRSAVFLF
jgi:hypothetical protein